MVEVTIKKAGKYSKVLPNGELKGHQQLKAGAVEEFPDWLAENLLEADMVELKDVIVAEEESEPEPDEGPLPEATKTATELADKHGINLRDVTGTGAGGKIITDDVKALIGPEEETDPALTEPEADPAE